MRFVQLSKKEYKEVSGKLIDVRNVAYTKGINENIRNDIINNSFQAAGFRFGNNLGKPPFTDRSTENNQGVWIYKDSLTDIVWVYYSDAWKKNHYKGGGFEFYLAGVNFGDWDGKEKIILDSFEVIIEFFKGGLK